MLYSLLISYTLAIAALTFAGAGEQTPSPLDIVNQRMRAYNEHDLDAFLSTYAEEVEVFTYPISPWEKARGTSSNCFHLCSGRLPCTSRYIINHKG